MRRASLIVLLIMIVFTGVWYGRAFTFGPTGDESEHWDRSFAFAQSGSIHQCWDDETRVLQTCDPKKDRGLIFSYLAGLAYKMIPDMAIASRLVMLLFTFLTFFIVVFYYHRRRILTASRLLVMAVLFFGSSIILDLSYYTRGYVPLGTFMVVSFILYWEGLLYLRQKKMVHAIIWGGLGLYVAYIPFIDQWQIEGVLALGIAVMTSLAAFNKKIAPMAGWLKQRSGMLVWIAILLAPILIQKFSHLSWITVSSVHVLNGFYATYLDNIFGWLRFILALNVGLLALSYAFKSKATMTFDRWMFVNGFLTGILCILYNSHNHIFFAKFVYLPTLMMIIGLSGMIEDFFVQRSVLIKMLSIYVIINLLISWANYYEHSNVKLAIGWLNKNMAQEDILIANDKADPALEFCGGKELLAKRFLVFDSTDTAHTIELKKYIDDNPQGRIFYFYDDGYGFRTWIFKVLTGKDRTPANDLCTYLRLKIPSVNVVTGLRQCGLEGFDHADLLKGLDQLLINGFEVHHPFSIRELWHHFFK